MIQPTTAAPTDQPTAQTMPKKMGMYHRDVYVSYPVLYPEHVRMVEHYTDQGYQEPRPRVNLMGKRDQLSGSSRRYEYRVPRWLTIDQARANTPDKWNSMRPANWTPYV